MLITKIRDKIASGIIFENCNAVESLKARTENDKLKTINRLYVGRIQKRL